jgi:exosortase A
MVSAMPPEASLQHPPGWLERVPPAWRAPLIQLALAWSSLVLLTWGEWVEMANQWWNISTYNHVLLVPPILIWLVRLRWPELRTMRPQACWPPFLWFAAGLLAWASGAAAGVNTVGQLGAVMLLQGATIVVLGPKVAAGLLFPLAYMFFLVPFGGEIIPALQAITAHIAVGLTHLSGVPASLSGVFIDTPVGRFEVAEACSGVKFLIAMIALGTLVAHMGFRSARRRALFMTACVVVPVLANGARAWGTIYVAQSRGVEFAAGFDHIVYGWVFFGLVMAGLLGAAWRFFDRAADDLLVNVPEIEASPALTAVARFEIEGWHALSAVLLLAAAAAAFGVSLARPLAHGVLAAVGLHP